MRTFGHGLLGHLAVDEFVRGPLVGVTREVLPLCHMEGSGGWLGAHGGIVDCRLPIVDSTRPCACRAGALTRREQHRTASPYPGLAVGAGNRRPGRHRGWRETWHSRRRRR